MTATQHPTAQTFTAYQITGHSAQRVVAVNLGDADVLKMIDAGTTLVFRLDGERLVACPTCANGCECETSTPGCGHYGCWGTTAGAADECSEYGAAKARVRAILHSRNA